MVSRAQQGLSWGLRSLQTKGIMRMELSSCALLSPVTASHSRPSSGSQLQPCKGERSRQCPTCAFRSGGGCVRPTRVAA